MIVDIIRVVAWLLLATSAGAFSGAVTVVAIGELRQRRRRDQEITLLMDRLSLTGALLLRVERDRARRA